MKKYLAQNGAIREVNPYPNFSTAHNHFESTVQSYATDLPDGEYLETELTKPITQSLTTRDGWVDDVLEGCKYRQFITSKPKESDAVVNNDIPITESQYLALTDLIPRSKVIDAIKQSPFNRFYKKDILILINNIKP